MTLQMGIIKVEIKVPALMKALEAFKENRMNALEVLSTEIQSSVSDFFNSILKTEMEIFLGQPDQTNNKRNGYQEREYALKGVGCLRIRHPVDRRREFKSAVLPPREQIDPRIREDLAVLHLAGLSNRVLALVSRRVLGVEVSRDTVTKSLDVIQDKAVLWLERPIDKKFWALFIDGTNFKVQRRGSTEKEPSLVVLGIDMQNRMSIISIQPGNKDDATSWREVFKDIIARGVDPHAVQIGVMDGLPGLETAFKESFTKAVTGRCWVHSLKNAMAKTPERLRDSFKMLAHAVMYANSEADANKAFSAFKTAMAGDAERAVRVIEKDLESLLAHYKFEQKFWRVLRTTNPIERINKELKRRTKSMETIGERTLEVLLAFTAMRLEYHWQRFSVDMPHLEKLADKQNRLESTIVQLVR